MKIILLNPPSPISGMHHIHDVYFGKMVPYAVFPFTLAQLGAVIKKKFPSMDIVILDADTDNNTRDECIEKIFGASILFIHSGIYSIHYDASLIKLIKQIFPAIKTIIIDPVSSPLFASRILNDYPYIDAIITSNYFQTVPDILAFYPEIDKVTGITTRNQKYTQDNNRQLNLDSIPFTAYEMVPTHKYALSFLKAPMVEQIIPGIRLLTSPLAPQGYPTYLSQKENKNNYNADRCSMSAQRIADELEYAVKQWGIWGVDFCDQNFARNQDRISDLCTEIINRSIRLRWRFASEGERINPELLDKMNRAGCSEIIVKYVSADRAHTVNTASIRLAIKEIRKARLKVRIKIIAGMWWETDSSLANTMRIVRSWCADAVSIASVAPYPQTELYDILNDKLVCTEDNLYGMLKKSSFVQGRSFLCDCVNYSAGEIERMSMVYFKRLYRAYLRHKAITEPISYIRLLKQSRSVAHAMTLIKCAISHLIRTEHQ